MAPSLIPGTLLGPYRLLEKLGEGGMGAVYKAQHEHLDKTVAIKVLPAHFTADADAVARFKREMKAVGKVAHPNIVQAHDAGEIHGTHFLAMEFVPGCDLNQWVKDRGPLPVDKACKIIRQAALGLAAAHAAGLVHRDVKPANLLVTKTGQIKLLDLGLARLATELPNQTHDLTAAGQTFGTPDYMAPEQWEDAHGVDGRCDLYALGCTLCFLLMGRAPFATADMASILKKLNAHARKPPPNLRTLVPGIPDGLAALFETLLAKRREDRIPTATALAEALLPYAKTTSTEDRPAAARSLTPAAGPASPASNKPSRKRLDEKLLEPLPSLQRLAPKPKAQSARASRPVWLIPALGGGSVLVIALGLMLVLSRGGRPPATPTTDASPNTQATPTASPSTPVAAAAESTALDALVEAPPISAIEVVPPATPNEPPATDAVAAATPPMPTTPPPVPAATAKPAAEPKTIRVGPDAGMVATLKQALTDANGGDTIEIATDEPLMITEPLSWDRPGPLTIKAADGKRPIVITDQTSRPKPDVIEFEASPAGETTPTAVTIQGLSFVDRIGATSVILKTGRPLIMTDVNCVMKRPTSAVFASAAVPFVSLERCYFWMQDASGVSRQIVQLRSGNTSIRQCLFAGYGPITLGDNSQEVRCEQTTFLSNNLAWAIRGEDTRVQLHMERNLFFDLKKVGSFTSLNMATLAERPTALALAKRQLPEYRGVNNCYFQCERFNQDLAPTAAEDLAAWQQFTGNGEVDPRFIDPQFMRPDLVNLSSERLFPPKAFALKATSPIRRMKIGCDVTQLPDLPPRLYEVVPAEMRPDLKP